MRLRRGHHDGCSMLIEQHPVAERPGESCGDLSPLANRRTQTGDMLFPDGDYRYGVAQLQERGSGVAGVVLRGPGEAQRQRSAITPK